MSSDARRIQKARTQSKWSPQLLLRGVLFGERRGSKVKGHSSFVNIRTGLPRYSTSLDDLHSTLSIMGILLSLKTHVGEKSPRRGISFPMGSLVLLSSSFVFWFLFKKKKRYDVSYRYYLTKKGKYYTEEYEKHACSFIITIH